MTTTPTTATGSAAPALAPGDEFDGYRIIAPRDQPTDYHARDRERDCDVILRFVHERGATPSDLTRVRREAKALVDLAHPNVAKVHGLGVHDGRLFLVLDHADHASGTAVDQYVASTAVSLRDLIAIFVEAGRGLAAAHIRAIVHRDLRPSAIAVDDAGRARVRDFGIGVGPVDALYAMAPEQVQGKPATIFSDQFVFCTTLWRVAVGAHPFHHDDRDAFRDALSRGEPVVEVGGLTRPQRRLWRVIERGLRREPAHRYAAMPELVRDLERLGRPAWRRLLGRG